VQHLLCQACEGGAVRGEGGGHKEAGREGDHELAEGALRGGGVRGPRAVGMGSADVDANMSFLGAPCGQGRTHSCSGSSNTHTCTRTHTCTYT